MPNEPRLIQGNASGPDWSNLLTATASRSERSVIRELFKRIRSGKIISFAGGMPDPALFPVEAMRRAVDAVLSDHALAPLALNYGPTEGYPPLRSWIAGHMTNLGCNVDVSNLLVTSGAQQALDLTCRTMLNPGDSIVVVAPTYLGALQIFRSYDAKILSVPTDESGPRIERFERALAEKPKFAYLVSDFANPSGQSIETSRREELVALARSKGVPIIDDAAYQQLRYDGDSPLPMIAVDQTAYGEQPGDPLGSGGVIHLGTFSKTIAPGLRLGWIVAPKPILDPVIKMKQAADLHSPMLNQLVSTRLVDEIYSHHVAGLIKHYREKRDAMVRALRSALPSNVTFSEPDGGMFVWLELPEHLDSIDLLERALEDAAVAFVPGAPFFASPSAGTHFCRLSFSGPSLDNIEQGVNEFCRLLRSMV